jgi:LacI family transcriptional regulator
LFSLLIAPTLHNTSQFCKRLQNDEGRAYNFSMSELRQKQITIFDVARASGVSYSTVSRVLNDFAFVKASTRQKVLSTTSELGYVANLQARSLAGGKSNLIGMLVPSLDNGYINVLSQSIDEALSQAGYDLMVYTTHHKKGKEAQFVNTLTGGLSDGLLLMVPLIDHEAPEMNYLELLRQRQFPYVLIDQIDEQKKSTVVDSTNWQGSYDATRYLTELGHKRIGFITGIMAIHSARERLAGYKAALQDAAIELDERLIVEGDFHQTGGYKATERLLGQSPRPTAIFASNDVSAFGAMDAARHAGLEIPKDISVIGFDDIPQASTTYPKLTTVRQPLREMGHLAVKLLLEHLSQPKTKPQQVTLKTSLIIRDSCRRVVRGKK